MGILEGENPIFEFTIPRLQNRYQNPLDLMK